MTSETVGGLPLWRFQNRPKKTTEKNETNHGSSCDVVTKVFEKENVQLAEEDFSNKSQSHEESQDGQSSCLEVVDDSCYPSQGQETPANTGQKGGYQGNCI